MLLTLVPKCYHLEKRFSGNRSYNNLVFYVGLHTIITKMSEFASDWCQVCRPFRGFHHISTYGGRHIVWFDTNWQPFINRWTLLYHCIPYSIWCKCSLSETLMSSHDRTSTTLFHMPSNLESIHISIYSGIAQQYT